MSVAQPPSENLPEFNNAVFKVANSTTLSLAKANTLYLARTGTASSTASTTTFSGSVVTNLNSTFNGVSVGLGSGSASTVIGNGAVCAGANSVSLGNTASCNVGSSNCTALGYGTQCAGANSVAIGYGVSSSANQILLGGATEYVSCVGTGANGSLQLASNLRLQTSYTSSPPATMLGQIVSGSTAGTTFVTGIATGTANITTIALPSAGVWSINYSVELTVNTSAMTASIQSLYCSLTTGGTFAQRISNSGITRTHSPIAYAINDNPVFSGSFVYYVNASATIFPVFSITTTAGTGTVTGTGYYTATRVG